MPIFEFDLETFTTVSLEATSEAAARKAVGEVLKALARTEYAIGEARSARGGTKSRGKPGRPADARVLLPEIEKLREEGLSIVAVARALGVHRSSVHRALVWARDGAVDSPRF